MWDMDRQKAHEDEYFELLYMANPLSRKPPPAEVQIADADAAIDEASPFLKEVKE